MLRTNLSTRPFYNIRAVQAALGALVAFVILFTMFNVISLLQLARPAVNGRWRPRRARRRTMPRSCRPMPQRVALR
jgi:hypothetical protein